MTISGSVWVPIGPSPIAQGGRQDNGLTSAIAVNPNNPNIIYQGTAGGGVWRTNDGGTTWTPIFDRQGSPGIGNPSALAIDPNNTSVIYVGTSGRLKSQRLFPLGAAGLFKSTDGGASFIRLGSGYPAGNTGNANQFFNDWINVIIVDPANSQTIYVGSGTGVFRSTDGGLNWTIGTSSNGDVSSLVLDASSPAGARILYAGIYNRRTATTPNVGLGVFQSTDGGQNWAPIFNAATAINAATPAVAAAVAAGNFGKVLVALAPPTSPPAAGGIQVLYVSLEGTGGAPDPVGLFINTNQGAAANWTLQSPGIPATLANTQGGYSFHMAVDPASPGDGVGDHIYLGTVGQARSTDSGLNFTTFPPGAPPWALHADTQSWAFAPQPGAPPLIRSQVFSGTDGGLARSTDGGANWTFLNTGNGGVPNARGIQTTLFYNMAVRSDAAATVTVGTAQDNGAQTTSGATAPGWSSPQGGDGWDVAYDGGAVTSRLYATSGFWPAPNTRLFVSTADGTNLPPTIPSALDITPWLGATTDQGFFLGSVATDPSTAGIVYVGGSQNLWRSLSGGAAGSWATIGAFPAPSFIAATASVAPSNGNNVVVAVGNQVSVSTNALATPATSVAFTPITRNLPNRNVLRAAFDPNDPTVIYAVLGGFSGITGLGPGTSGHVFRTTIGGTAWTDISPDLDVPFGALALDGTDTPTTIYVGTDLGVLRSVDDGATWYVLDDIHFPRAWVTDLVIGRGSGILRAATYGRGVFEFAVPTGPVIAVNLENGFEFGTVCEAPAHLTLQVFNVGTANLVIHSVQRLMGSTAFVVEPFPATPLVIAPGGEVDFTVHYTPTAPGAADSATIRIRSNDPGAPTLDLMATGTGGVATAEIAIADAGDFGEVCLGSFVDRDLVINNSGTCPLEITAITSSSPGFVVPAVISFPLVVSAGGSITVPLRFQPTALGSAAATIRVFSNDPASPTQLRVRGTAPPPRLVLSIADHGDFCHTCVGDCNDKPLILSNSGKCKLTVTGISSSSGEFLVPDVVIFPLVIGAGSAVPLTLRFQPTSFGAKSATITVTSDDPAGPRTVAVSGIAPPPILRVTGTTYFGPVDLGLRAHQTLSICNVGPCDLHVSRVGFTPQPCCPEHDGCAEPERVEHPPNDQRCTDFCLVNNPFPATVKPGTCLGVLIQYTPTCDGVRCCELVIESDDPVTPRKTLTVTGHMHRTLKAALKCWAASELRELLDAGRRRC
jgi:hypothetical protein